MKRLKIKQNKKKREREEKKEKRGVEKKGKKRERCGSFFFLTYHKTRIWGEGQKPDKKKMFISLTKKKGLVFVKQFLFCSFAFVKKKEREYKNQVNCNSSCHLFIYL